MQNHLIKAFEKWLVQDGIFALAMTTESAGLLIDRFLDMQESFQLVVPVRIIGYPQI